MGEALPRELRAFPALARVVAAGPYDRGAVVDRVCRELKEGFGLCRADYVATDAVAARHPLIERALAERRAVTDGAKLAIPLLTDESCLGFLIGDCEGDPLELDERRLQLLTALADVASVFVDKAAAHGRLEQSLAARTNFVSLASHELRTPIAVVHGVVSTLHLRGDELDAEQLAELRATAFEHTSRLAALAEQLLDLSRLEAGAVAGERRRLRPRRLVDELLLRVAPERVGDVTVEIDPDLVLYADADALEHVLSNLVVNALRYGAPPVHVAAAGTTLVVEDRGSGVDPELVPRLFERFSRGGEPGGSGLGLAIARSYAEALGGSLEYERGDPRGARFVLRLPATAGAPRPRGRRSAARP